MCNIEFPLVQLLKGGEETSWRVIKAGEAACNWPAHHQGSLVVCYDMLVICWLYNVHVHCLVNLACTGCPRLVGPCGCTGDCTTHVSCLWVVDSSFHRVVFIYMGVVLLAVYILNITIVDCPVNSACTACTGCPRPASVGLWPGATIPRHFENRWSFNLKMAMTMIIMMMNDDNYNVNLISLKMVMMMIMMEMYWIG